MVMLGTTIDPTEAATETEISAVGPVRAPRRGRIVRLLGAVLAGLLLTVAAGACTPEQNETYTLINNSRSAARLKALAWDDTLAKKAQSWAEHLAREGKLSHSNLTSGVPSGWKYLGENVGYGGSISKVHTAYMNSPGHKANILNPRFTHVGTGVAKGKNGLVYTVHVFMQR